MPPGKEWAQAAVDEGAAGPATKDWVSLGNRGSNSNVERDLFRWLDLERWTQLRPYVIWLPREFKKDEGYKLHPTPILPPHEVLHSIWSFGERQWIISMLGQDGQKGFRKRSVR